jgi:predicted nuclease of predicted toxin-antitoxin system
MRFLADECCDMNVVETLRAEGYDVVSMSEISPRADDNAVLRFASEQKRVLITEDKDFGQLFYALARKETSVILLRFPATARTRIGETVVAAVRELSAAGGKGLFAVVTPGRLRVSRDVE